MRLAILSDIHSNLEALDAVLASADEHGCDRIIACGDIVGYGADPDGVVARLRERNAITIAGNHDLAATGGFDVRWFNASASAAIAWTQGVMTDETKAFLKSLSPQQETDHGLMVHGSVRDPVAEYLLSADDAAVSFELAQFPIAFFGHTHLPTIFRRAPDGHVRGWMLSEGEEVLLSRDDRYMLNPGSVGQPRDRDPRAAFIVYEEGRAVGHRVPYAIDAAAKKIRDAGLPEWLADRLSLGE